MAPQSTLQAESQKNSFFSKNGQTAIQNKKNHQELQTKTCNDRYSKPQQKYRLATVSKILLGGLNRFYVATTFALSSALVYTRHLFSPREGFLTHLCNIRENITNQTTTEMKKRRELDRKIRKKYMLAMILALNFVKVILRYIKIGYNINVIRQTACMVVNPVTVNNFASLFGCTPAGWDSDSMTAPA